MSLLDDFTSLEKARRNTGGTKCRVARVMESMTEEEAAGLARLIDATDVFGSSIANLLQTHGHDINGGHVQHHRRRLRGGGCTCPRPDEAA